MRKSGSKKAHPNNRAQSPPRMLRAREADTADSFAFARINSQARLVEDIIRSHAEIQRALGAKTTTFAFPSGQKFVGRGEKTHSYVPLIANHFVAGRDFRDETMNDPLFLRSRPALRPGFRQPADRTTDTLDRRRGGKWASGRSSFCTRSVIPSARPRLPKCSKRFAVSRTIPPTTGESTRVRTPSDRFLMHCAIEPRGHGICSKPRSLRSGIAPVLRSRGARHSATAASCLTTNKPSPFRGRGNGGRYQPVERSW